ncbi:MAG: hypothetical protein P8H55_01280 [Hellea sp.]|nr:hypothetical protein [Hellea sp.]
MKLHFLFLLVLFFISACGFSPMHSPTSTNNSSLFENISVELNEIENIGNKKIGFYLIQRIRDRIGTNPGKDVLILTPKIGLGKYGTTSDDVASRYDTNLIVNYELRNKKTGNLLSSGLVSGSSTFAAPIDPYGLIAASNDAEQVIAKDVADRLLFKLATHYSEENK